MRQKELFIISIYSLLSVLFFIETGWAFEGGGIIFPGERVGNIRLGEPPPEEMASGDIIDIEIESDRGGVQMIRVKSPRYYIARSRLRIGNNIESIFRYHGRGNTEIVSDRIVMRYPEQGIDFEINKSNEQITAITIYRPELPDLPTEQYKQFKKYLK
ncbi:MAG: hypothetical protein K8R13_11990 [Methanococcoides sp.]|nr:hypothetical protein [Methanococcoides sp.]